MAHHRPTGAQAAHISAQLQASVVACNERGLYFAAKWSAELLNSFARPPETGDSSSDTEVDADISVPAVPPSNRDSLEPRRQRKELPRYLMAKSFFDCREYDRCAAVFLPAQVPHSTPSDHAWSPTKSRAAPAPKQPRSVAGRSVPPPAASSEPPPPPLPKHLSQKALFLALYAKYLSGEKRKNEDSEAILGPRDGPCTTNSEVPGIAAVLDEYFASRGGLEDMANSQGWLDYLYGIILIKLKSEDLAKQWLLRSVNINPFNWSAWLELASLIESEDVLHQVSQHVPRNIMSFFFTVHCKQELFVQDNEVFTILGQLQDIFPHSPWLQQQKALLQYHAKDYDAAAELFNNLIRRHPHRLDSMEIYSNLLYILPNRPKLATLAAMASETDKFRPETNCILGNYYSLIAEHEKAVLHFRRALALDRNFQTAWTLMGHEYIELKNHQAAIESYRRAVDINRKDYRAWYGLGQGYEMLECWSYSLFYYQRAASLYGADPKMWSAVGNAYHRCGKNANAIQALKRALIAGSQIEPNPGFGVAEADPLALAVGGALDCTILYEIAILYEKEQNYEESAAYMELCLAQEEGADDGQEGIGVTHVTSKARLWLARWNFSCGHWLRVMELANELQQDGVEVEEAKGLLKDARARLQAEQGKKASMEHAFASSSSFRVSLDMPR